MRSSPHAGHHFTPRMASSAHVRRRGTRSPDPSARRAPAPACEPLSYSTPNISFAMRATSAGAANRVQRTCAPAEVPHAARANRRRSQEITGGRHSVYATARPTSPSRRGPLRLAPRIESSAHARRRGTRSLRVNHVPPGLGHTVSLGNLEVPPERDALAVETPTHLVLLKLPNVWQRRMSPLVGRDRLTGWTCKGPKINFRRRVLCSHTSSMATGCHANVEP